MTLRNVLPPVLLALLALALIPTSAFAAPAVTGEFAVPALQANNKLAEGPEGNMWVTDSFNVGEFDVSKITPAGVVQSFKLTGVNFPDGIAKGPEGNLWVTQEGGVAKFAPSNPEGTTVATGLVQVKSGASIVTGPDNNMWVATTGFVIRFAPATPGTPTKFEFGGLAPTDIDAAGSLLAIADGAGGHQIVTVNTNGTPAKNYELSGGSQGVAASKSGQIAYSQQGSTPEQVGLITPPTASPSINLPGGVGDPFGVAFGSDEAFWIPLSAKDGVERLTTTGAISFVGGFAPNSMARQIAPGPGNTLWVTLARNENPTVARISGLEPPKPATTNPPPVVPPKAPQTSINNGPMGTTTIGKGPKGTIKTNGGHAAVKFSFSSSVAGSSFQCRLTQIVTHGKKAKGSKATVFKACKSPQSYSLKPGRYRFEVRAVAAGLTDQTAAQSSFKVVHVAAKRHR